MEATGQRKCEECSRPTVNCWEFVPIVIETADRSTVTWTNKVTTYLPQGRELASVCDACGAERGARTRRVWRRALRWSVAVLVAVTVARLAVHLSGLDGKSESAVTTLYFFMALAGLSAIVWGSALAGRRKMSGRAFAEEMARQRVHQRAQAKEDQRIEEHTKARIAARKEGRLPPPTPDEIRVGRDRGVEVMSPAQWEAVRASLRVRQSP